MSEQPPPVDPHPHEPRSAVPAAQEPAVDASSPARSYAPLFMKGCGWTLLSILLGVGVLIAGKGDFESVGSALAGVVILLLVLSSSGLTGFWGNKS